MTVAADPTVSPSITMAAAAFGWGLLTGFVVGAVVGTVAGLTTVPLVGTLVGAVVGVVIAVLPAAIGAAGVADLARRQPLPLSPDGMAADLGRLFAQLVAFTRRLARAHGWR